MDNQTKAIAWIGVAVVAFFFLKSAGIFSKLAGGQPVGAGAGSGMIGVGSVGFGPVPNNQTAANIGAVMSGVGALGTDLANIFGGGDSGN